MHTNIHIYIHTYIYIHTQKHTHILTHMRCVLSQACDIEIMLIAITSFLVTFGSGYMDIEDSQERYQTV